MGTKIQQNSVKIQAWTSKCPLLCSPVSQNRPRVSQDAKVKPPIIPNDKFASQKYQDPLATMQRICNPEAMSNDRGPAAEGVAHKIRRTPAGEPGVSRLSHHALQNLKTQAGLPTAAGPSRLEPKMLHFSSLNFSRFFAMQNLQNLCTWTATRTSFGSPNPPKSNKKTVLKAT